MLCITAAGRACNQDVFAFVDKAALGKVHDLTPVDISLGVIIQIPQVRLNAEVGMPYFLVDAAVLLVVPLCFDKVSDELVGRQGFGDA